LEQYCVEVLFAAVQATEETLELLATTLELLLGFELDEGVATELELGTVARVPLQRVPSPSLVEPAYKYPYLLHSTRRV